MLPPQPSLSVPLRKIVTAAQNGSGAGFRTGVLDAICSMPRQAPTTYCG